MAKRTEISKTPVVVFKPEALAPATQTNRCKGVRLEQG